MSAVSGDSRPEMTVVLVTVTTSLTNTRQRFSLFSLLTRVFRAKPVIWRQLQTLELPLLNAPPSW